MDRAIPLSRSGDALFHQVYRHLRDAILTGALAGGEKLPSTRGLARELGVSRTVVLAAYDQLLAEGLADARGGSGTYAAVGLAPRERREASARISLARYGRAAASLAGSLDFPGRRPTPLRYDFAYGGRGDIETFPFAMWRRILLRHLRRAPVHTLDYGSAEGSQDLRAAIAAHLRRSRGVNCEAGQVIVLNGSQQALDLIARVLIEPGDRVAVENPLYQGSREIFRTAGARLAPVAVDQDGLDPARLPTGARLVLVTPSHQFPTGAILPLGRRLALLAWARRQRAVVIEDDYDGEFRYEGQPLESLQSLDREGRVIFVGTFSRTLFSALRIGYLVAPRPLVGPLTAAKWLCDRHTATLEQETLAEFIASGMYERHLRRLRRTILSRREELLSAVAKYLGDRVEITGAGSGTHIVLWPRGRVTEAAIIAQAAGRGVGVYGIAPYFLGRPRRLGLLLGYHRMREADIAEGIRRLAGVI